MTTQKCSSSSSFQSESSFPVGYCCWIWDGTIWVLHTCHCAEGYACEDPNEGSAGAGSYFGEIRKFPCSRLPPP